MTKIGLALGDEHVEESTDVKVSKVKANQLAQSFGVVRRAQR